MKPIVIQPWEESEQGWGKRPDGISVHLSHTACREYCQREWDAEIARTNGQVPYEYSRESGNPYVVDVSDELYDQIITALGDMQGIRMWSSHPLYQEICKYK